MAYEKFGYNYNIGGLIFILEFFRYYSAALILYINFLPESLSGNPFLSQVSFGNGFPPKAKHVNDTLSPSRRLGERSPNNCGTAGGSRK